MGLSARGAGRIRHIAYLYYLSRASIRVAIEALYGGATPCEGSLATLITKPALWPLGAFPIFIWN